MSDRYIKGFLRLMKAQNYKINTRPYEVNIVGVRSTSTIPNKFDDRLYIFWKDDKGNWEGHDYAITSDPGTYWLKKPMNVDGTAILKEGQWEYKIGSHRGYRALNQRGKVTVIRDYDRNAVLDFNNGKETTGYFGINIHKASATGTSTNVDKWSAGCQVFANSEDFADFMNLVQRSVDKYGNDTIYYTLVDERAFARSLKRYFVYGIIAFGVTFALYGGYKFVVGKPFLPKL